MLRSVAVYGSWSIIIEYKSQDNVHLFVILFLNIYSFAEF